MFLCDDKFDRHLAPHHAPFSNPPVGLNPLFLFTPSTNTIQGKTIVITGGGGAFGAVGARYFVSQGANVVLVDVNQAALDKAIADVARGVPKSTVGSMRIKASACDICDEAAVARVVADTVETFGGIDLLWNNAGLQGQMKPLLLYPASDFKAVQTVNVVGSFVMLQACARAMAASGKGGAVVQTGSVAGLRGTPTMSAYVSSKAAVHGLTMSAAKDLAPHKIRVNTVMPALIGPNDGFMWARQNELHAASGSPYFARDPAEVAKAKVGGVPLKRLGTVEEVVEAVAYLLSDEASYVTGTSLVVAGGMA